LGSAVIIQFETLSPAAATAVASEADQWRMSFGGTLVSD